MAKRPPRRRTRAPRVRIPRLFAEICKVALKGSADPCEAKFTPGAYQPKYPLPSLKETIAFSRRVYADPNLILPDECMRGLEKIEHQSHTTELIEPFEFAWPESGLIKPEERFEINQTLDDMAPMAPEKIEEPEKPVDEVKTTAVEAPTLTEVMQELVDLMELDYSIRADGVYLHETVQGLADGLDLEPMIGAILKADPDTALEAFFALMEKVDNGLATLDHRLGELETATTSSMVSEEKTVERLVINLDDSPLAFVIGVDPETTVDQLVENMIVELKERLTAIDNELKAASTEEATRLLTERRSEVARQKSELEAALAKSSVSDEEIERRVREERGAKVRDIIRKLDETSYALPLELRQIADNFGETRTRYASSAHQLKTAAQILYDTLVVAENVRTELSLLKYRIVEESGDQKEQAIQSLETMLVAAEERVRSFIELRAAFEARNFVTKLSGFRTTNMVKSQLRKTTIQKLRRVVSDCALYGMPLPGEQRDRIAAAILRLQELQVQTMLSFSRLEITDYNDLFSENEDSDESLLGLFKEYREFLTTTRRQGIVAAEIGKLGGLKAVLNHLKNLEGEVTIDEARSIFKVPTLRYHELVRILLMAFATIVDKRQGMKIKNLLNILVTSGYIDQSEVSTVRSAADALKNCKEPLFTVRQLKATDWRWQANEQALRRGEELLELCKESAEAVTMHLKQAKADYKIATREQYKKRRLERQQKDAS